MRKAALCVLFLLSIAVSGQRREIHILSANDMHSTISAFPQLAAIADSLRALYPSLLVFSAGDNRTGNPLNDMFETSGYPMVALMNQVGFNGSALGNHDFDMHSLPPLIPLSNFRYICANIVADDSTGIRTVPYQVFDVEGMKVGVVGLTQVGQRGHPDTHPDNLGGMRFEEPSVVLPRYEWLSRQCDATILLTHEGYRMDTLIAKEFPWIDLIIGGHSHTQLKGKEVIGGVLVTQNRNKLPFVTHTTLVVDSGMVVEKKAEYINVKHFTKKNRVVDEMVRAFSNNPDFKHVLAHAESPFDNIYEVGCMVCDALMEETGADIAIHNQRGVRLEYHPGGDISVFDVLAIDPFGNVGYIMTLTGKEVEMVITKYSRMDVLHFPHLAGIRAEVTLDKKDPMVITSIKLLDENGRKLDKKKTYRVVTNSYVAAACKAYNINNMVRVNRETADMIMRYLEKRKTVDYKGVHRIVFK